MNRIGTIFAAVSITFFPLGVVGSAVALPASMTFFVSSAGSGEGADLGGDTPTRHDILTGSQPDGRAFPAGDDRTCGNWTKSTQGAAMVGHHDRLGLRDDEPSKSWSSSHPTRGPEGGCSQTDLRSTGGDGLIYCFAAQ